MNKNWYAVITADVLYAENLTPRQKLLMAVIANLSNEKGWCWASNAYFAEIMKCSIPSIQRDLRHLESGGYLGRAMQIGKDGKVEVRALTPISQTIYPHVTHDIPPVSSVTPPHVTSDTYNNKGNNKPNNKVNIAFEVFWDAYGRKVGDKAKCVKKWESLKDSERTDIIEYIRLWVPTIRDKQYQPFPETFLNQRRWENELPKHIEVKKSVHFSTNYE